MEPTDKIRNSIIMAVANDEQAKNATNGYQLSLSLDNYAVNQKLMQNSEQNQEGSKIYIMADLKKHKDGMTYSWLRAYFDSDTYQKSSQQEINMLKPETASKVP